MGLASFWPTVPVFCRVCGRQLTRDEACAIPASLFDTEPDGADHITVCCAEDCPACSPKEAP